MMSPSPIAPGDYVYLSDDMEKIYFSLGNGIRAQSKVESLLWKQLQDRYEFRKVTEDKGIKVYQAVRAKGVPQ
jgi:hypothetical protein